MKGASNGSGAAMPGAEHRTSNVHRSTFKDGGQNGTAPPKYDLEERLLENATRLIRIFDRSIRTTRANSADSTSLFEAVPDGAPDLDCWKLDVERWTLDVEPPAGHPRKQVTYRRKEATP
jgi:hypothetical protein